MLGPQMRRAQRWRGVPTFGWALRSCLDLHLLLEQCVHQLQFIKDNHRCGLRQCCY